MMTDRPQTKKRILVFCDFYLPSLGGGGGMWVVANIVERFGDRYDFFIVAGNRNDRGSFEKISGIRENSWNEVGGARVFYLDSSILRDNTVQKLVNEVQPDIVLLNSVFSNSTIRYLQARKRGKIPNLPSIIAPCGELLAGALAIKPWKKRLFLAYARFTGLYRGLLWRASFESERDAIRNSFGNEPRICIAADLTPKTILPDFGLAAKPEKNPGTVKLIFLSRIVRIKNLRFLLEQLRQITEKSIELDIIGPVEDRVYWAECSALIRQLPPNVKVATHGAMKNASALKHLLKAHFFVLPTLSENFGFVFIEALAAGCPLIISDRTEWSWIENVNAGWAIPLENPSQWLARLAEAIDQSDAEFREMSVAARSSAVKWLAASSLEAATAEMFALAIDGNEPQNSR